MAYAFMSEPVNGESEIIIQRISKNAIKIQTHNSLTDEQVQELYWLVYAMEKLGKTMKELLNM